jgi:thiamine-phosphate pyrophosphorylase
MNFEVPVRYLISPGDASADNFQTFKEQFLATVELSVSSGVSLVQIREKRITTKQLFELSSAVAKITADSETTLLINSRADVALAANADGVHLPEDGLPIEIVRKAFPNLIIGSSVHSVEGAVEAKEADFLLFGAVFDSGEKIGVGLGKLKEVIAAVETPVLAVGGVDANNFQQVLDTGAAGFAAIRYLNDHAALEKLR